MAKNLWAPLACAAALVVVGCGGGSSGGGAACKACSAGHLVGTAAGGAPVQGTLAVVDAAGARRTAAISGTGGFSLDVSGLTAPYLLEVAGTVGGRAAVLHSLAVQADVGTSAVDVTPLTELLTAFVLGADPRAVFNTATPDLSAVTAARLAAAEALVAEKLAPVLQAYGVGGADVRNAEFTADGAGMDGALDAVNVTPVQDPASGAPRYQLTVATVADPITVDPAQLDTLSLGGVNQALLAELAAILPEIDQRLQQLAGLFASGVPGADALAPFFTSGGFYQNGLDLDTYESAVLRKGTTFVGAAFSRAAVEELDGADHVRVSFTVTLAPAGAGQKRISWWMRKVGGAWVAEGNGEPAEASVTYLARLTSVPLTRDQITARTDQFVTSTTAAPGQFCYSGVDTIPNGNGSLRVWTCEGNGNLFGTAVLGGTWPYLDSDAIPANRQNTRTYSQFIGQASARVRPYVVLTVSTTEVDPRTHHVVVDGPGLPGAGLTLTWPRPEIPRAHFILEGDIFDWNAFDSDRCGQMSPIPAGCALDWTQVKAGGGYLFSFYGEGELSPFRTMTVRLLGKPRTPQAWLADKDRLFPQFQLAPGQRFTLANILDLSGGFRPGGTVTVDWSVPPDPTVAMENLLVWREYYVGDVVLEANHRKEPHTFSLAGSAARHQACTFDSGPDAGGTTAWAWSTLIGRDVYGNELDHEVAPENPY